MKVLIVGAGPTGLTAGVELARRGITAIIIDKKEQGSTMSRAVGINPQSLKILESSGVTKTLLAEGIKYKNALFYVNEQKWGTLNFSSAQPVQYGYDFILGLPQDRTEAILSAKFTELGGKILYHHELVSIKTQNDTIRAKIANGEEFTCDYLLGADGVHSTTRHAIGIACPGIKLPEEWSIADVSTTDLSHLNETVALYSLSHGKVVFIAPIAKNRYRLVSNTKNAIKSLPFKLKTTKIHREGTFHIKIAQAPSYQEGKIFLAGDAAHCHSPVGGRGMNLGIADAADFAHKLVNHDLETYTKTRYLEDKRVIAGSEFLRKMMTSPNIFKRYAMLLGIKLIFHVPFLHHKFASKFMYG
ncbi:MAG: FAD-dependent monooxygenase [Gammaproteobacteria bacterium]|nr:FAD-dependent monooxygenase [Gammaproteobacteria bacterium]